MYNIIEVKDYNEIIEYLKLARKVKKDKVEYLNAACAFDIETSLIPCHPIMKEVKGEIEIDHYEIDSDFYNETLSDIYESPSSIMYIWMMAFLIPGYDDVLYIEGRTWEEWTTFMGFLTYNLSLNEKRFLSIYVHNFAYEFQFIQCFFNWKKVFARAPRKVLRAKAFEGFEFRCSYFLSNMSLEKFLENEEGVEHKKAVGYLDYNIYRDGDTILSDEEKIYVRNDVIGLVEAISGRISEEHNIANIPMTSTGYVREEVRNKTKENKSYYYFIKKNFPDVDEYLLEKAAFRGGDTHANRIWAGKNLRNIYSYDIKSSYPAVMLMEEFPIGKGSYRIVENLEQYLELRDHYFMVMQVELWGIEVKSDTPMPYIDLAHCKKQSNVQMDNGRVLSADYLRINITSLDLDIILSEYEDSLSIYFNCVYVYRKGKLPYAIREKTLEFFERKTLLDGIEEKHYEYVKSKNKLNSIFGMMVTAFDNPDIVYENLEWDEKEVDIEEQLRKKKFSYNTFLLYVWGIFITAHARKRLHKMLKKIEMDVVYIDTDSIKFMGEYNKIFFEEENALWLERAKELDISLTAKDSNGNVYTMGLWEEETPYDEFKTLGAKKYCVKKKGQDKYIVTVSGLNKKEGSKQIHSLDDFEVGRVFKDIGRKVAFYNDIQPRYISIKGKEILLTPNVALIDTTYTLGITESYAELIYNSVK